MKFGPRPLAFAIVLLMLMTAASTFLLADDQAPVRKARILQSSYTSSFNVFVIDQDGRPIGGPVGPATVKIVGNTTNPGGWQAYADGAVTITGIFGNSTGIAYDLTVEASGFQIAFTTAVAIENTATNVTVIMTGGYILGKVTTASIPEVAIANATVYIPSLGPGYSNRTNSLGQYIMRGIPTGRTYTVWANATGYVGVASNVLVPILGSVDFALTSQTGSIIGYIYNAATHAPLNDTNVSIKIGTSVTLIMSSENGSYEFTSVPPGTYAVTAARDGFNSETASNVVVTRENTTRLDFNLTEKPTLLHGAIRSGTLLLVKANVTILGTGLFNISGPDGTYAITNIPAGTYTIEASRPGYVTAQFVRTIKPGESLELNINLTAIPGAILQGVVSTMVGSSKVPLVDVKVTLVSTNVTQNSTSTNIHGEFAFTGLTPGNYTLLFEHADYRPTEYSGITVTNETGAARQFLMTPLRHGFSGFIFGFDMAHSMMILGLFLTIAILGVAVYLRIRTIQVPGNAPAVYDDVEDEMPDEANADGGGDLEDRLSESKNGGKG